MNGRRETRRVTLASALELSQPPDWESEESTGPSPQAKHQDACPRGCCPSGRPHGMNLVPTRKCTEFVLGNHHQRQPGSPHPQKPPVWVAISSDRATLVQP